MCECVNVEMGSYDNQRTFPIPVHMVEYRKARKAAGLLPLISVDKCLIYDLAYLWYNGVVTTGCCCGHNKVAGMINVKSKEDYFVALGLGFKPHPHTEATGGGCYTVQPLYITDIEYYFIKWGLFSAPTRSEA